MVQPLWRFIIPPLSLPRPSIRSRIVHFTSELSGDDDPAAGAGWTTDEDMGAGEGHLGGRMGKGPKTDRRVLPSSSHPSLFTR